MTYEKFLTVILRQQKMERQIMAAYDLNIDLIEFVDGYSEIINTLIEEIYGEDGLEWYSWFCCESEYGQRDWSKTDSYKVDDNGNMVIEHKAGEVRFGAHDENGNPICYSIESLWQYLEANHLKSRT
jgi:hypothetical protein